LKVSLSADHSFRVSRRDRFIVEWRGNCCPERGITRKTFQHALRRNDFALRNAVDQFV
jgi:hypothetical protein